MAINFSCPISGEQRDNTTVRVVAGFIFAARIGVLFTVVTTILYAANLLFAGSAVLIILLLCASLESFFSFCLGCWMYSLFPKKLGNVLSRNFLK